MSSNRRALIRKSLADIADLDLLKVSEQIARGAPGGRPNILWVLQHDLVQSIHSYSDAPPGQRRCRRARFHPSLHNFARLFAGTLSALSPGCTRRPSVATKPYLLSLLWSEVTSRNPGTPADCPDLPGLDFVQLSKAFFRSARWANSRPSRRSHTIGSRNRSTGHSQFGPAGGVTVRIRRASTP